MKKPSKMTVVYSINDNSEFRREKARIMSLFREIGEKPWSITGVSLGDEMARIELIKDAHHTGRYDLLDEILGLVDMSSVMTIHDLEEF